MLFFRAVLDVRYNTLNVGFSVVMGRRARYGELNQTGATVRQASSSNLLSVA